jgi:predicted naringenin-chalcone synthase
MNPQVTAAVIAAAVSAAGVVVALLSARWQLHGKLSELELKRQELERIGATLQAEAEALRQTVMKDVLARRMNAYAALWSVFISYERNWVIEERPLDTAWAAAFLVALNACNAEHGVFFSEQVYRPFFEYRKRLIDITRRARAGKPIERKDVDALVEVSTTGMGDMKSLAGAMKDDLGSYMRVVIQAA